MDLSLLNLVCSGTFPSSSQFPGTQPRSISVGLVDGMYARIDNDFFLSLAKMKDVVEKPHLTAKQNETAQDLELQNERGSLLQREMPLTSKSF